MENLGYLLAAFIIIWVGVFSYLFILLGRERRIRRELDSLKEVLREKRDD